MKSRALTTRDNGKDQRRAGNLPIVLGQLRKDLAGIKTSGDALDLAKRAAYSKRVFEAIGRSVQECNQFAEIYLAAYWKFGNLVKDTPAHRPTKASIDAGLPGSEKQRLYARRLRHALAEKQISDYVQVATAQLETASISGCLEWADPGRHGNLKGDYEWYTPAAIIGAARSVMGGGIDLDPASCAAANEIVKATEFFTEVDNGLERDWHGRVFLNPPFAHPTVKFFADKLLASFHAGDVDQAVWLSNACVDTEWWQALALAGSVCCHCGRVKFYGPDGQLQPPTLGQTIIYLGPHHGEFRTQFSPFGVVLVCQ